MAQMPKVHVHVFYLFLLSSFFLHTKLAVVTASTEQLDFSLERDAAGSARVGGGRTALDDYVRENDRHYRWYDTEQVLYGILPRGFWRGHVLNLTSQQWLSNKDVQPAIWTHHLVVIVPAQVKVRSTAFLLLSGRDNKDFTPGVTDKEILLVANLAVHTGSVGVVLFQIPNQPSLFSEDPLQMHRYEDDVIAYTWRHFLDREGVDVDAVQWLARLPMTKAAVRGMDAVQEFAGQELKLKIDKFVVGGASKRGWTTWTTGAVDKRVVGIVPMVMDALKLVQNLHHMFRSLGGWPIAFEPYFMLNLTSALDLHSFHKLTDIVDPFSYLDRLTMPKMIVISSNDEFFMLDDSRFYWKELRGESHLLVLPNTDHSLFTGLPLLTAALHAFYLSICDQQEEQQQQHEAGTTCDDQATSAPDATSADVKHAPSNTYSNVDAVSARSKFLDPEDLEAVLLDRPRGSWTNQERALSQSTRRLLISQLSGVQANAPRLRGMSIQRREEREQMSQESRLEGGRGRGGGGGVDQLGQYDMSGFAGSGSGNCPLRRGRPRMTWRLDPMTGALHVQTEEKPLLARLWYAFTPRGSKRRDFRFVVANLGNCTARRRVGDRACIQPIRFRKRRLRPLPRARGTGAAAAEYIVHLEAPEEGFGVFFVEVTFVGPRRWVPFTFTTEAFFVPDLYPFDDCSFESCLGSLV